MNRGAAFFISFLLAIRIAWTGFEGASAHRQPQGSTRSVYTLRMLAFENISKRPMGMHQERFKKNALACM